MREKKISIQDSAVLLGNSLHQQLPILFNWELQQQLMQQPVVLLMLILGISWINFVVCRVFNYKYLARFVRRHFGKLYAERLGRQNT